MRLRAWFVFGGVVAGVCVASMGCPGNDPQPINHDSGVCALYDFGIDETTEAGADADAGSDAIDAIDAIDATDAPATEADGLAETEADAEIGAETDAVTDAVTDADADEAAETASVPDLVPKVCRSDVENIVFVACSLPSCHGRFPDGQGGLYIGKIGDWTQNVVDAKSKERKDLLRVKPGDPKSSWLAHKLVGDQCMFGALCLDGDCGDQMPATNQPLSPTDLNTILEWIRQGADSTTDCSGGTK